MVPKMDVAKLKEAGKNFIHGFKLYEIISVILMVLAIVGVGITDFSPARSYWYWLAMAPVFACACLIIEWTRVDTQGRSWLSILKTQLLTWFGLLVAVQLVYLLLRAGRLTYESTGLVILLLLALTTFIAGIQLGFQLCVLGAFLAFTLLFVAFLEQYVWVIASVAILGVFATFFVLKRRRKHSG